MWNSKRNTLPVGNDVVDLRDPDSQPESLHPRWDERVFTESERELLSRSKSRHRARWALWAAKESAFKAARQADPDARFIPRTFRIRDVSDAQLTALGSSTGQSLGSQVGSDAIGDGAPLRLDSPTGSWDVRVMVTAEFVHATAVAAEGDVPSWEVEQSGSPRPGVAADSERAFGSRRACVLARALVADCRGLESATLRVEQGRPPKVLAGDRVLPIAVSMSHHGRFVACATDSC